MSFFICYSLSSRELRTVQLLEILPKKKRTRPCDWSKRELIDGMLYQLKNGCNWKDLPKEFPPYSTVYWHYKQWRNAGVFEELMQVLHEQVREQVKKKRKWTTLIIIDSQAVKNTCTAGVDSKGFCFYKATNGIN
jgi:transposase